MDRGGWLGCTLVRRGPSWAQLRGPCGRRGRRTAPRYEQADRGLIARSGRGREKTGHKPSKIGMSLPYRASKLPPSCRELVFVWPGFWSRTLFRHDIIWEGESAITRLGARAAREERRPVVFSTGRVCAGSVWASDFTYCRTKIEIPDFRPSRNTLNTYFHSYYCYYRNCNHFRRFH